MYKEKKSLPQPKESNCGEADEDDTPFLSKFEAIFGYFILAIFGYIRDFLKYLGIDQVKLASDYVSRDFAPLYTTFESFYTRNMYRKVRDCFNRPIGSCPGRHVTLLERRSNDFNWTLETTGKRIETINMASYNYLGFAENSSEPARKSKDAIARYGVSVCSSAREMGTLSIHNQLEREVASFLNVEDALVFGMGFATNALNIPTLVNKNDLIISDSQNHASIVLGARLSKATVKVFKKNDMAALEHQLKRAVFYGKAKGQKYGKIVIFIEGIHSMEGSIVNLKEVLRLKTKYKAYVYLDEAHSIGAIGPHGRGVCDYYNVDTRQVDVLMGTFTKSFGSAGGYIAGDKKLISTLRSFSHATTYASAMPPGVAAQTLAVIQQLKHDSSRFVKLARNTHYFRSRLYELGAIVYGDYDSPVVPLILFAPAKTIEFSRQMLERFGIAVVVVGFPATPLYESRARFCLSSSHTKEDLDATIEAIRNVGNLLGIFHAKYKRPLPPNFSYESQ